MKLFNRKIWTWNLIWKKNCPFCKLDKDEKKLLIYETKYWEIRHNKYPYYWDKRHLMSIPKKHRKYAYELNNEELKDYKKIELFMKDYYNWEQYFSFIRHTTWWRSIEHLHYHYLPGILLYKEKIDNNKYLQIK